MKIAVRVPNWLGDAVMALPAVQAINRASGGNVVVVAPSSVAAIFSELPVIMTRRGVDTGAMKKAEAERIILLTHSFSTALAARLAGIPDRAGYRYHLRGPLLTTRVPLPMPRLHQVDEYNHLVEVLGFGPATGDPVLENRGSKLNDDNVIVLAPGASYGSAKRWPGFTDLARALANRGRRVVVVGGKGEGLEAGIGQNVIDRAGQTTLDEALDIVGRAEAVVSNDSGLAHAARALGRRTIVLFGPTAPDRTAPRGAAIIRGEAKCAPCLLRTCPIDHRCMRAITVEHVLEELGA